jgi:hypothetical protein
MRLGEMLVRDGRLTDAQLKQALFSQARDGGRLGTVLVELGLIDLEALTVYLGLELGIPIATGAMLERAKRSAFRLLQPAQAFKHKCVPIVVQDRQLITAIEDPHDLVTLEALTQITGYRVLPRVAPEVRIYYYIERYYGVARPARFLRFLDTPRGDTKAPDTGLPARPLPGLPPVSATPVAPPGPRPRLRTGKMAAQSFDDSEALELDAEDLIDTLDAEDTSGPAERSGEIPRPPAPAPTPTPAPFVAIAPRPTPINAEAALAELATVGDRNRIVEILLGFASATFESGILFAVRDQLAFGWKAFGHLPGMANVEHLLVPLDAPSVVQAACAADSGVFHGAVAPSTVNAYVYKVLGCAEPSYAAAAVVTIGKRVVNVLYGHGLDLTPLQLEDLTEICRAAAEAYARLIVGRKKR